MTNPNTTKSSKPDAQAIIEILQARLLALSDDAATLNPQEVERSAKAISQLVRGLQDAQTYLDRVGDHQGYRDRPSRQTRQQFLRKLKRLVDRGILDELDDDE